MKYCSYECPTNWERKAAHASTSTPEAYSDTSKVLKKKNPFWEIYTVLNASYQNVKYKT